MKRIFKITLQILAILLFVLLCQIVGGFWIDAWEINKIALPLHYFIAPIIYFLLFFAGFKYIQNHFLKILKLMG